MAIEFEEVDEPFNMRRTSRIWSSYPEGAIVYGNKFSRHERVFENHFVNRTSRSFRLDAPLGDDDSIESNDYWIPGSGRGAIGSEISQKIDIEIIDPSNIDNFEKILIPKFVSVNHAAADDIYRKFFELSQSVESLSVRDARLSERLRSTITVSAGTIGILMSFVLVSLSLLSVVSGVLLVHPVVSLMLLIPSLGFVAMEWAARRGWPI